MRLKSHKRINTKKWDDCIHRSLNAKPYALTSWLNAVSPRWDGVIIGDYEAVFPIPYKSRIIYSEVVQPPFTQQLGLFYDDPEYLAALPDILSLLKGRYRRGTLQLNDLNFSSSLEDARTRKNYKFSYDDLTMDDLSATHRRNIRKAEKVGITLDEVAVEKFMRGLSLSNPVFNSEIKKHRKTLDRLMASMGSQGMGRAIGAYHNKNLVAAVFLVFYKDTAYYLLPFTTDIGRKLGAMHYLIFHLNQHYPSINRFDFEGSEIPGVEKFILGFNAMLRPYPIVRW